MPPYAGFVDWKKQRIPIALGFIGIILVAANNLVPGFLALVIALLYGGYNSDAAMEHKDVF
ncbi:MAG: hypothetical protein ABH863_05840 [Candidatus Micrarchaeota archaeon]